MSKKTSKNKSIKANTNSEELSSKSLVKTYSIIGILILVYFLTTYSYKSIDKKMDKIADINTTISNKLDLSNNILILSSADNFIGLTECSRLPLGRLSIKSTMNKAFDSGSPNIITHKIKDNEKNKLIVAGKNDGFKQIVFSNIIKSNGNTINSDVVLDVPQDDYFMLSTDYEDNYENIRIIKNDNTIIKINE